MRKISALNTTGDADDVGHWIDNVLRCHPETKMSIEHKLRDKGVREMRWIADVKAADFHQFFNMTFYEARVMVTTLQSNEENKVEEDVPADIGGGPGGGGILEAVIAGTVLCFYPFFEGTHQQKKLFE